jgi:hypothetical protein
VIVLKVGESLTLHGAVLSANGGDAVTPSFGGGGAGGSIVIVPYPPSPPNDENYTGFQLVSTDSSSAIRADGGNGDLWDDATCGVTYCRGGGSGAGGRVFLDFITPDFVPVDGGSTSLLEALGSSVAFRQQQQRRHLQFDAQLTPNVTVSANPGSVFWSTDFADGAADGGSQQAKTCAAGSEGPICTQCPLGFAKAGDSGDPQTASCQMCDPGSFAADTGTAECDSCPPGTFAGAKGESMCTACTGSGSSSEFQDSPGQSECKQCASKPAKSEYRLVGDENPHYDFLLGNQGPQCAYVCNPGYVSTSCVSPIDLITGPLGGTVSFFLVIVLAVLSLYVFWAFALKRGERCPGFCREYMTPNLEQEFLQLSKKQSTNKRRRWYVSAGATTRARRGSGGAGGKLDDSSAPFLDRVARLHLVEKDLSQHVCRIYFSGYNSFHCPWHLPTKPPADVAPLVYPERWRYFAQDCNDIAAWWQNEDWSGGSIPGLPGSPSSSRTSQDHLPLGQHRHPSGNARTPSSSSFKANHGAGSMGPGGGPAHDAYKNFGSAEEDDAGLCARLARWVSAPFYWPYDRLKYLAIAVLCYPLANSYLQEQRLKKIRQLQVFLLRDDTDFIRSLRARSLEGAIRFTVSPDLTLAYIDIIWKEPTIRFCRDIEPGKPRLPLIMALAGHGGYSSPFALDTNDPAVRAVPSRLELLIDDNWLDFVAELNTLLRLLSRGHLVSTMKYVLDFLNSRNLTDKLGGMKVELCYQKFVIQEEQHEPWSTGAAGSRHPSTSSGPGYRMSESGLSLGGGGMPGGGGTEMLPPNLTSEFHWRRVTRPIDIEDGTKLGVWLSFQGTSNSHFLDRSFDGLAMDNGQARGTDTGPGGGNSSKLMSNVRGAAWGLGKAVSNRMYRGTSQPVTLEKAGTPQTHHARNRSSEKKMMVKNQIDKCRGRTQTYDVSQVELGSSRGLSSSNSAAAAAAVASSGYSSSHAKSGSYNAPTVQDLSASSVTILDMEEDAGSGGGSARAAGAPPLSVFHMREASHTDDGDSLDRIAQQAIWGVDDSEAAAEGGEGTNTGTSTALSEMGKTDSEVHTDKVLQHAMHRAKNNLSSNINFDSDFVAINSGSGGHQNPLWPNQGDDMESSGGGGGLQKHIKTISGGLSGGLFEYSLEAKFGHRGAEGPGGAGNPSSCSIRCNPPPYSIRYHPCPYSIRCKSPP